MHKNKSLKMFYFVLEAKQNIKIEKMTNACYFGMSGQSFVSFASYLLERQYGLLME